MNPETEKEPPHDEHARDVVEINSAMVEAGVAAYLKNRPESYQFTDIVAAIFRAMWDASKRPAAALRVLEQYSQKEP